MKKLFKTLLIAILAVCSLCACAFAVTACKKDDGETTSASYVFVIQNSDGTAVNGQTGGAEGTKVKTQICTSMCVTLFTQNIYPDAEGKLTLTQSQVNAFFGSSTDVTEFSFHVLGVPGYNSDCEFEVNGAGTYTCVLYTASPQG